MRRVGPFVVVVEEDVDVVEGGGLMGVGVVVGVVVGGDGGSDSGDVVGDTVAVAVVVVVAVLRTLSGFGLLEGCCLGWKGARLFAGLGGGLSGRFGWSCGRLLQALAVFGGGACLKVVSRNGALGRAGAGMMSVHVVLKLMGTPCGSDWTAATPEYELLKPGSKLLLPAQPCIPASYVGGVTVPEA